MAEQSTLHNARRGAVSLSLQLRYAMGSAAEGATGWLVVFASLLKFFMTCYHLPHLALAPKPDTKKFLSNWIASAKSNTRASSTKPNKFNDQS